MLKNKIILLFLFAFNQLQVYGQGPHWQWANGIGGNKGSHITDITSDDVNGTVFLSGSFDSLMIIANDTIQSLIPYRLVN